MKHHLFAVVLACAPFAALAEGTTYVGGALNAFVPETSDVYGRVEAYIEFETGSGLYAGLWLGATDVTPDNVELDLYFGLRKSFGRIDFDIGYTRYYYNDTGDCCGELILSGSTDLGDMWNVGLDLSTDFEDVQYATLNASYQITDQVGISGSYTFYNDDTTDWDLGVTTSLSDTTAVVVRYYDNDYGDEAKVKIAFTWDTDLATLSGN